MQEPVTEGGAASEKDYYAVLQVPPNAGRSMISAAYDALARKYHPDLFREPDDPERMSELDEAFDVLDDSARRAEYDARRAPTVEGAAATPSGSRGASFWGPLALVIAGLIATTASALVLLTDVLDGGGAKLGEVVTTDSGLKYVDIEFGTGPAPEAGQTVVVHYTGTLENGMRFDSSEGGQPFQFVLGRREVIDGIDEGIATMRVGGKRRLIIPPDLAYGAEGREAIPPNTTIIFEVRLVDVR